MLELLVTPENLVSQGAFKVLHHANHTYLHIWNLQYAGAYIYQKFVNCSPIPNYEGSEPVEDKT